MVVNLESYFQAVDRLTSNFIERLEKAVAIPSVSTDESRRPDVIRMGQFLVDELVSLGATAEARSIGNQQGVKDLPLPPIIVARYGSSPSKRTILVYGHYDVQPALKEDGWASDPFTLTIGSDDCMYGRGSTDDKGPVLGWLASIQAHQEAKLDYPVNLLMCFEGMEETGSEGLEKFVQTECRPGGFFEGSHAVCISDSSWLGTEKPCLTYGTRGVLYYGLAISGPGQDLHSGMFGGAMQEPMVDLVRILGSLVDSTGNIQIPQLMDMVTPLTDAEKALYGTIDYAMTDLYEAAGSKTTISDDKDQALMATWRFPSLSIHGIEGAFHSPGGKTVIPAKVIGKFSIRTVPDMHSDKVNEVVVKYVRDTFAKLCKGSKNTLEIAPLSEGGVWWVANPWHWNFTAASKATEMVYGVKPDLTRGGGSIPIIPTFEQATGKNVLLLPMGRSTDAPHSINEKLDKRNYIEGIKLFGAYLHCVAEEPMVETKELGK